MKNMKYIVICGMLILAFSVSACREKEAVIETSVSEESVSETEETESESMVNTSEEKEKDAETDTEVASEEKTESEDIVTPITIKEGDKRVEELVAKYPEMSEEAVAVLFYEFNAYSLSLEALNHFHNERNDDISLRTIFQDYKFSYLFDTYAGDFEIEYSKSFDVSDFVVDAEARAFAEEVDAYFSQIAYTEDESTRDEMGMKIQNYLNGQNEIFSRDFVNPSECENNFATTYLWIATYYFTYMNESDAALTESVKVMLREKSPLARRFFVEDEKYWTEYWASPEGQKILEQLRQEASEGAQ